MSRTRGNFFKIDYFPCNPGQIYDTNISIIAEIIASGGGPGLGESPLAIISADLRSRPPDILPKPRRH